MTDSMHDSEAPIPVDSAPDCAVNPAPAEVHAAPAVHDGSTLNNDAPRAAAMVEKFVHLFSANHRRLFGYIMVLVHDRAAAEEVFQEMSLILWREFHNYRDDGDFIRWANAMSFNQVRKWRRTRTRDRLIFSEGLIEDIARDRDAMEAEMSPRREALSLCLKQLKERDRTIIDLYYGQKTTADLVAAQLGKSVHTIYKALKTIRKALLKCIERKLATQQD